MKKGELIFCFVALIIAIFFYVVSLGFRATTTYYSTVFYTKFLAEILFFLIVVFLFQIGWFHYKKKDTDRSNEIITEGKFGLAHVFTIGILIVMPTLFRYLGFTLAGGIFLISTMSIYWINESTTRASWKDILFITLLSLISLFGMYLLFAVLLKIPFPRGVLSMS